MKNIIGVIGKSGHGKDVVGKIVQYLTAKDIGSSFTTDMILTHQDISGYLNTEWEIKKFATKLKQFTSLLTGIPVEKFEDQEFKKQPLDVDWDIREETMPCGCDRIMEYGFTNGKCDNCSEPTLVSFHKMTARDFLQKLGTDAIRNNFHKDTWVNALFAEYVVKNLPQRQDTIEEKLYKLECHLMWGEMFPKWVITDTRFENEYYKIKDLGGIVIRVNKPIVQTDKFCFDCEEGFNFEQMEKDNKGCPYCDGGNYASVLFEQDNHSSETELDNIEADYTIENNGSLEDLIEKVREILIKEKINKRENYMAKRKSIVEQMKPLQDKVNERMTENEKYYTPSAEEFHIGFEFENRLTEWDNWFQCVGDRDNLDNTYDDFENDLENVSNLYRVKLLDKLDIESLGFEHDPTIADGRFLFFKDFERAGEKLSCGLLYVPSTNWVLLYAHVKRVDGVLQGGYVLELPENKLTVTCSTMFTGVIKNKSKLKGILKSVDVYEQ